MRNEDLAQTCLRLYRVNRELSRWDEYDANDLLPPDQRRGLERPKLTRGGLKELQLIRLHWGRALLGTQRLGSWTGALAGARGCRASPVRTASRCAMPAFARTRGSSRSVTRSRSLLTEA
jgi:hypothetical protein